MSISINIPYFGSFPSSSYTAGLLEANHTQDELQLDDNRFLVYFQQQNQYIGYVGLYTFDNYVLNSTVDVNTQELLFTERAYGARLYKLSDNKAILVRNKDLFIIDYTNNVITIEHEELNFFEGGLGLFNGLPSNNTELSSFDAFWVKNNELFYIESTTPAYTSVSNPGNHKLFRMVYTPQTTSITKTELFDYNTLTSAASDFKIQFGSNITRIPNSTDICISFAPTIGDTRVSTPSLRWVARLNESGIVQQTYPLPDLTDPKVTPITPIGAFALTSNRIIYMGTNLTSIRHYNGTEILPLINTNSINLSNPSKYSFIPLDTTHAMIQAGPYIQVLKMLSERLCGFKTVNSDIENVQYRKNILQKINDNLITVYNRTSSFRLNGNSGATYPQFNIRRLYQEGS